MLDTKTSELLESKVFERLNIDQSDESGAASLTNMISKIAICATILTLQEYEKLNSGNPE